MLLFCSKTGIWSGIVIQRWTTERHPWRGYKMIDIDQHFYDDGQAEEHQDVLEGLRDGF